MNSPGINSKNNLQDGESGILKEMLSENPVFRDAWIEYNEFVSEKNLPHRAVILSGAAKSGNTLVRFVYHNLLNIKINGSTETLTYSELNEIQRNIGFPHVLVDQGLFRRPHDYDYSEFPVMFHSHHGYEPFWSAIGKVVFVVRNPLDCMVSYWYQNIQNEVGKRGSQSADDYARNLIAHWITVYNQTVPHADYVLPYEDLMLRPFETIEPCFKGLGLQFSRQQLELAIEMSRIDNIRKMEDKSGEHHGHMIYNENFHLGPTPQWHKDARFARSGEIGQWQAELSPDTVEALLQTVRENNIDTDSFKFTP